MTRRSPSILCISLAVALVASAGCVTHGGKARELALPRGWRCVGEGQWGIVDDSPTVLWQGKADGPTSLVIGRLKGRGNVWRCLVEPGPATKQTGIWFGASPDLSSGYLFTLDGGDHAAGATLRDASGKVLWDDPSAPWTYYTPYLLEGIVEKGRVRAQALRWDRATLVAQSNWVETGARKVRHERSFALHTHGGAARFYGWERAKAPLSPIVPDSPSALRLAADSSSPWIIIGPGDWRWSSAEKTVLRQAAAVERSTAVNGGLAAGEGVWRCRVMVEPGAGGAGMAMQIDPELGHGFLVWLGGTFGAGGLMLYRLPGQALWSSPQNTWFYDIEYVLEGTIRNGKVCARLLDADGRTVLASSPDFDLTAEEKGRSGFIGFQTWKGAARFSDWSIQPPAMSGQP